MRRRKTRIRMLPRRRLQNKREIYPSKSAIAWRRRSDAVSLPTDCECLLATCCSNFARSSFSAVVTSVVAELRTNRSRHNEHVTRTGTRPRYSEKIRCVSFI